jgi:CBS domain-containing protein
MQAKRLTIFVGETDQWHHTSLYLAILEKLKAAGCAGATVTSGIAGFGAHGHIKTRRLVEVSFDLPLIITAIDRAENVERVLPEITGMLAGGVVTVEDVEVVYYSAAFKGGVPHLPVSSVMSVQPESVTPDASVVDVVERLLQRDYTELPVIDDSGHLIGAIGDTDLVTAGAASEGLSLEKAVGPEVVREHLAEVKKGDGRVRGIMHSQVLSVRPATPLREAASLMHSNGVRHLFVVDGDHRLVGVIGRLDIFQRIVSGYTLRTAPPVHRLPLQHRTAAEIMERSFPIISPDTPLPEVVDMLSASDVKRVLVVDEAGKLAGIVTDTDILRRVDPAEKPGLFTQLRSRWSAQAKQEVRRAFGQRAADVMTSPVVSVREGSPVIEALTISVDQHIKRLPVLDGEGKPVGIVSRPALLAAALDLANGTDHR